MARKTSVIRESFEKGNGVFRLAPVFVPRRFSQAGSFGQLSGDEYFVSEAAAREGVRIENQSAWEPMVILKHFGPNNRESPSSVVVKV